MVPDLQGRWRENQYRRTGLNDVLYQLGMPWWKRLYVTSTNWENEQTIVQRGNFFRIHGFSKTRREQKGLPYKINIDIMLVYFFSNFAKKTTFIFLRISN